MTDYSRKYRSKHLQNQIDVAKRLQAAMVRIGDKVARLASDPQAKYVKSFNFQSNQHLNKVLSSITAELQGEVLSITEAAISKSWEISNQKNDITVNTYFEGLEGLRKKPADYLTTNSEALRAFINRTSDTGSLSDRVWKIADSFRDEMEVHLGYGIANGDSAATISRRIREYLNNPEQLFRRVRNEAGKLGLSENAKQFHPGQGVYRSSYKNALRVSRSETNQAYLLNDHLRWKIMDFVTGVHIMLSAQHPVTDICDSMQGDYPKGFVFTGWHSQCLCHATPILMPEKDFINSLNGEPVSVDEIKDVPEGYKQWINDNKKRVEGWKSKPYFIRDNYKNGDLNKGFVFKVPKGIKVPTKSAPIPAPIPKPEPIKFVPAKTIQEAEAFGNTLFKEANYKGLSVDGMNLIHERYVQLKTEFKNIDLDYVGNYQEFLNRHKEYKKQVLAMGYGEKYNSLVITPKSLKESNYIQEAEHFKKLPFANTSGKLLKAMQAPDEVQKLALEAERRNVTSRNPANAFTHEIGHRIMDNLPNDLKRELFVILDKEKSLGWSRLISDYASFKPVEFFAESFAAYNMPELRKFVSPKIIEFIEKNLKL